MLVKATGRSLVFLVLIAISSVFVSDVKGQNQSFGFGYIHVSQFGDKAQIVVIDPNNPDQKNTVTNVSIPDGWMASPSFAAATSGDGNWIALGFYSPDLSRAMVGVINAKTGQTHEIIEGSLGSGGNNVFWSPNSQQLAINMLLPDQQDTDLFLYNISDNAVISLTSDNFQQRDIAWSPDSNFITTFTHPCTGSTICSDRLEVYNISTRKLDQWIDLTKLPYNGASACYPAVSMDLDKIAFASNCNLTIGTSTDFPNEVYIWKRSSSSLKQVTSYAPELDGRLFVGLYQYFWLDLQQLLIGANTRVADGPEIQQLSIYNFEKNQLAPISTELGSEFVANSNADIIALIQKPAIVVDNANLGQTANLSFDTLSGLTTSSDQILRNVVDSQSTIPAYCAGLWSPDGTILATTYSRTYCAHIEGVRFTSPTLKTDVNVSIKEDQDNDAYVPLGWIGLS